MGELCVGGYGASRVFTNSCSLIRELQSFELIAAEKAAEF